jgi:hypothetical protein
MHGGTIRAQNRTDRTGLKVVVELPRAVRGVAQAGSPPETKV